MLVLSLIAVLQVAPASSAPSVLDQVARVHLAQAEVPPPSAVPGDAPLAGDRRSLYELTREYQKLQDDRPGLGFPIAFMAIGTGVLIIDGLLLLSVAVGATVFLSPEVYIVIAIIGAGFLVPGIILLPFRLKRRAEVDGQLQDLAALIRVRETQAQPPQYQPQPDDMLPPPPPPPPVGRSSAPEPSIVLAAF